MFVGQTGSRLVYANRDTPIRNFTVKAINFLRFFDSYRSLIPKMRVQESSSRIKHVRIFLNCVSDKVDQLLQHEHNKKFIEVEYIKNALKEIGIQLNNPHTFIILDEICELPASSLCHKSRRHELNIIKSTIQDNLRRYRPCNPTAAANQFSPQTIMTNSFKASKPIPIPNSAKVNDSLIKEDLLIGRPIPKPKEPIKK